MAKNAQWEITRDVLHEEIGTIPASPNATKSRVGTQSFGFDEARRPEMKHRFRMYGGDAVPGNDTEDLIYEGLCTSNDDDEAFAPLDDFGTPDAGCTEIRYLQEDGRWETL